MTTTAPLSKTPRGHQDMTGWRPVTCREADLIRRQGAGLTVASSLTDPGGTFGPPVIFTEWWWCTEVGQEPVLRDYRSGSCTHWIATSADAAAMDEAGA